MSWSEHTYTHTYTQMVQKKKKKKNSLCDIYRTQKNIRFLPPPQDEVFATIRSSAHDLIKGVRFVCWRTKSRSRSRNPACGPPRCRDFFCHHKTPLFSRRRRGGGVWRRQKTPDWRRGHAQTENKKAFAASRQNDQNRVGGGGKWSTNNAQKVMSVFMFQAILQILKCCKAQHNATKRAKGLQLETYCRRLFVSPWYFSDFCHKTIYRGYQQWESTVQRLYKQTTSAQQ